ncbi:MAG: T9SS type A sorting domain-containing protein, partial [Candidatus Kapaibacterium sp.]
PSGTIYYAGTSVGLYSTTTIDSSKTVWAQEAPSTIGNLIVESLDVRQSDGRVIVSTQGGGVFKNVQISAVKGHALSSGQFLQLEQNYPNPFTSQSNIRFTISTRSNVLLELYNALGKKMGIVASGSYEQGSHIIELSGKDLSAGNYFLRVIADDAVSTKMITIVK